MGSGANTEYIGALQSQILKIMHSYTLKQSIIYRATQLQHSAYR